MRKFFVLSAIFMLSVVVAFAADFTPSVMTFSAPSSIKYDFDGTTLSFNCTLAGAPAANSIFAVYTRGKGSEIGAVQNGFLGWHYVNQIDTCLYMSSPMALEQGSNNIAWDGKDNAGVAVPAGDYTYYVWGYDNVSNRVQATPAWNATDHTGVDLGWDPAETIWAYDDNGQMYAKPIIINGGRGVALSEAMVDIYVPKWYLGNDPEVPGLTETCVTTVWGADKGDIALDPNNHMMLFKASQNPNGMVEIRKFSWEPNDVGVLQTDWGVDGIAAFPLVGDAPTSAFYNSIATIEGGTDIFSTNCSIIDGRDESWLMYIDIASGDLVNEVDLGPWWVRLDDGEKNGIGPGGGPSDISDGYNRTMTLNFHGSCVTQVVDPYRFGSDDIMDLTLWENGNGDLIGDRHFSGGELAWVCNDYAVEPYRYHAVRDRTGFELTTGAGIGSVSFELFGPDGTGMGQFSFAGDTASLCWGHYLVTEGTPYDGIYVDAYKLGGASTFHFLGYDSIQGIITDQVSVDEAVADFSVSAAYPNPFNPTTTIDFTVPAGHVNVDIYNVAGQKIDTIVNEFRNAGSYSVNWDASNFSAGVYFCTVKAGEFSKTSKLTLLK